MIKEYAAEVIRRIDVETQARVDRIATGFCTSIEAYRDECGVIRGLGLAREMLQDTLKNVEEDDA